ELSRQVRDMMIKRRKEGSSVGGHWEVIVTGVPAGLGSLVISDRKLRVEIVQGNIWTQARKEENIKQAFEARRRHGQVVHEEITNENNQFKRRTNRMEGIEGSISTGMPLIIRGVIKPIPTMLTPISTVDINSKEEKDTRYERSDVCALPRAIVVVESVIAPVLANAFLEKFGGDSIEEIAERYSR